MEMGNIGPPRQKRHRTAQADPQIQDEAALVEPAEIHSIADILGLVVNYCDIEVLLKMELACRRFSSGFCWSVLKFFDLPHFIRSFRIPWRMETPSITDIRRKAMVPVLKRITQNASSIQSIVVYNDPREHSQEEIEALWELISRVGPQLRAVKGCNPNTLLPALPLLTPAILEKFALTFLDKHTKAGWHLPIPSNIDEMVWPCAPNLKVLELSFHQDQLIPIMNIVASRLNKLERLVIVKSHLKDWRDPFSKGDIDAISNAARANARTLKSLSLPECFFNAMMDAFEAEGHSKRQDQWPNLFKWIPFKFVVPARQILGANHALFTRFSQQMNPGEALEFMQNFDYTFGSESNLTAASFLAQLVSVPLTLNDETSVKPFVQFVLGHIYTWLSVTASEELCSYFSGIVYHSTKLLRTLQHHVQGSPELASQVSEQMRAVVTLLFSQIDSFCAEGFNMSNLPACMLDIVADSDNFSWLFNKRLSDPSEFLKFVDQCGINLNYGHDEKPNHRQDLLWHLEQITGQPSDAESPLFYLPFFRQHIQTLHKLIIHTFTMSNLIPDPVFLCFFLAAFALDENFLSLFIYKYRVASFGFKKCKDAFDVLEAATGQPILSPDEQKLIILHLWKVALESSGTDAEIRFDVKRLLHNFGDAPARIQKWAKDPMDDSFVVHGRKSRRLWIQKLVLEELNKRAVQTQTPIQAETL